MGCAIREYRPGDATGLRRCVVVLQEFERGIDPRLRPGDSMADAYCAQLHARCGAAGGHVFVAELSGGVIEFEAAARAAGAPELRIGVLAQNVAARRLYLAAAFVPHVEILTKRWAI